MRVAATVAGVGEFCGPDSRGERAMLYVVGQIRCDRLLPLLMRSAAIDSKYDDLYIIQPLLSLG